MTEGLSDVTDCYYGFPIALSYPHFLDADPQLLVNVTGSQPNRSMHESFFYINPVSIQSDAEDDDDNGNVNEMLAMQIDDDSWW